MSVVSSKITALREQRGWSKTYVAKKLQMNLSTYANYEYGNREPDLETVNKLANLFNVSADSLMGRDTSDQQKSELTLDDAVDSVMSYNGQPVTPHDREMMKSLWKAYLSSKD